VYYIKNQMTILKLTTTTEPLPAGVKNIKLETIAAGRKGAHVTTYVTDTPLNYRMTEEGGATFVLADEQIQSIAGAGGAGAQGGDAGQPAALPDVVSEKYFAYVNDTSEEVQTDIRYGEKHPIFFIADNGSLEMPFGYRIDPSSPEAVWPYLGFTTTRVLLEADQAIGPEPITLTTGNNTVTWDTFRARIPTGRYTLTELLDRLSTIFQTAGDRGFRADYTTGKIRFNTLYTVRFTNPTGSIWATLGFTRLTLLPPGPPVKRGQAIPIEVINDGLTVATFPTDVAEMRYLASTTDEAQTVELLGQREGGGIYQYTYNKTTKTWTPGKKIRSTFALPDIILPEDGLELSEDNPFLFTTSGSLIFSSLPADLNVTTEAGPLTLQAGATPFFTVETWVKFANGPQDADEKIVTNATFGLYREKGTGRLGFHIKNQHWVGTTILNADLWYHVAVVAQPRAPLTGSLSTFGVQAGMVCSGPGIDGYALVKPGVTGDFELTPLPVDINVDTFTFEVSEIVIFLDGKTEVLTKDAGPINWTATETDVDAVLQIGIQKPLLVEAVEKRRTTDSPILDVASNGGFFYLVYNEGITILPRPDDLPSPVTLPNAFKIASFGTRVYVAATSEGAPVVQGYNIRPNGGLNRIVGPPTPVNSPVLDMVMTDEYLYVTTTNTIKTWKIGLEGSLTPMANLSPVTGVDKIAVNPAGTYAYATLTSGKLQLYRITNGSLVFQREVSLTVNQLLVTADLVYVTTNAGLRVYETGGAFLILIEHLLPNAQQVTVDPSGRIYVSTPGGILQIYRLTEERDDFQAGVPFDTGLPNIAGLYADATFVSITQGSTWQQYSQQADTGGQLSNVRITGAPVYRGNFFPSVMPLPALSTTTLLLLFEGNDDVSISKNSASEAFISFYEMIIPTTFTALTGTLTLPGEGSYILSFDYTNDTAENKLSLNEKVIFTLETPGGTFNQAVYMTAPTTVSFTEEETVALTNIRLKKVRTTDLGKGGQLDAKFLVATGKKQFDDYFGGGRGYVGGASAGFLQPLGSAGGRSFPATAHRLAINTDNAARSATVTYLNGITPIPPRVGTLSTDYTTFHGETWVAPTGPQAWDLLTYGQNVFLAGERGTGELALFDGAIWTALQGPSGIQWQGLFYSPAVDFFLGVTAAGEIWINTDIKNGDWRLTLAAGWTEDNTLKVFITYGPTGFVIINDSVNVVLYSNKTGTGGWTSVENALPVGSYLGLAAGAGGKIVAVSNTTVVESTDGGLTWQAGTIAINTTVNGNIVGVVDGHQGFKIITEEGYVYRQTEALTWVADADRVGITGITAIGYGGGKYIAMKANGDYALGNAWVVRLNPDPDSAFDPKVVVFGQGLFLTGTGYQLGEYDAAAYTARINIETDEIEITRSTPDGLKTVTTIPMAIGINGLTINGIQYIPLTREGLEGSNGQPMLTSGAFPFSNTMYRKVQVELVGASGGGSAQNAGGLGARVILRGVRLAENIFLSVGVAGSGPGPKYPGGGATAVYTLDENGRTTGFSVAGGGGGAGANGNGGNAAENTGQKGQDGGGSPGSGGSDEVPGLPDGQPKIKLGQADTDLDLPGQLGGGGGGVTGGGNGSSIFSSGGGGGGSGTEGLTYMAVSYETAGLPGNGSVRIVTLPDLELDTDRSDATILYLIQAPLPNHYAYSRTVAYVVNIDAQSNVQVTARTAELETVTDFLGAAKQYETVVIIDKETKNTTIFGKTPPICFHTGTGILTPTGYVPVEQLNEGDLVLTARGETVPIVKQVSFQTTSTACPLYCLPAGSLSPGVPLKDLYLSHNHAFKVEGHWRHMKCSPTAYELVKPIITYHHLYLPDYFRYTLIAEGVEVESAFEETRYLRMGWLCEETECVPLKCEKVLF